jgi:hypothetical protein
MAVADPFHTHTARPFHDHAVLRQNDGYVGARRVSVRRRNDPNENGWRRCHVSYRR